MDDLSTKQITSLLSKISKKDAKAFKKLYSYYYDRLLYFILSNGVHISMSEEVLNDTFMEIWDKPNTYNDKKNTKFYTWLCSIAKHKSIDLLRKEEKFLSSQAEPFNKKSDLELRGSADTDAPINKYNTEFSWNSLKHYEAEELGRVTDTCINKLPPKYRTISYSVFLQDKGYKQISSELDLPEGTVKSRMSTIRKKMKICLGNAYSGINLWREK